MHALGINSILDKGNSKLQTVTIGCDLMPSPHDYNIEFTFDAEGNFALFELFPGGKQRASRLSRETESPPHLSQRLFGRLIPLPPCRNRESARINLLNVDSIAKFG